MPIMVFMIELGRPVVQSSPLITDSASDCTNVISGIVIPSTTKTQLL